MVKENARVEFGVETIDQICIWTVPCVHHCYETTYDHGHYERRGKSFGQRPILKGDGGGSGGTVDRRHP